jgi:hypothetical protein
MQMRTILAFSGNKVYVITGQGNGTGIDVSNIYDVQFEADCVINGVITDSDVFLKGIRSLWNQAKLPKNNVFLSVEGNQIKTNRVTVPENINSRKIKEIVSREFASNEVSIDDNYFTYFPSDSKQMVYGIAAEKKFLEEMVALLEKAGLKVAGIYTSRCSAIVLLNYIDVIKDKNCAILSMSGDMLMMILVDNGKYAGLSNIRIFSEHGTPSFGAEVARNLNQLIQYQASQKTSGKIDAAYFIGIDKADFNACNEQAAAIGITSYELDSIDKIHAVSLTKGFGHFGVLVISQNQANLMKEIMTNNEKVKERDRKLLLLLPILVIAAVLVFIGSLLTVSNNNKEKTMDELSEYVNDSSNQATASEYSMYLTEAGNLNEKYSAAEDIRQAIESYPLATSALNQIIAASGEGIVDVTINSYSSLTGELSFKAHGQNADKINEFIKALQDTGIFYNVTYSGYELDQNDSTYYVNVTCLLSGEAGRG